MSRARLTPVDIVYYGVVLTTLAIMAEPIYNALTNNAASLGTSEAYVFQLVFPAAIVTVLTMIYYTAVSGGAG